MICRGQSSASTRLTGERPAPARPRLASDPIAPPRSTNAKDMVKLMGSGGTLVTHGGKLPAQVDYAGAGRSAAKWSEYLSERGVSAKSA